MIRMKSHDAERRAEGNAAADQASAHDGGTGLGIRDKQLILHHDGDAAVLWNGR